MFIDAYNNLLLMESLAFGPGSLGYISFEKFAKQIIMERYGEQMTLQDKEALDHFIQMKN